MRRVALVALTAILAIGPLAAASVDLSQPESAIALPALALKSNDLVGLFHAMPEADQAKAKAEWDKNRSSMSPNDKAEFDEFMAKMTASDAVDQMVAQAEPQLKQFNPQEAAAGVQMLGGMMAMQLAQKPETKDFAQMGQQLVMDVAGWIPTAGIEKTENLRTACTHVVAAVNALGVTTADEFAALELDELLTRLGPAIKEAKSALTVYGLDPDAFLGSLTLTDITGEGDKRQAKLNFSAFGKPYIIPVDLMQKDGFWTFDSDAAQKKFAPVMGGGPGEM
jgi:hypothetical protein